MIQIETSELKVCQINEEFHTRILTRNDRGSVSFIILHMSQKDKLYIKTLFLVWEAIGPY